MRSDILYTSSRLGSEPSSADPVDLRLLRGLARPCAEGFALWVRSLPALAVRVALPMAAALALVPVLGRDALRRLATTDAPLSLTGPDLSSIALLYAAVLVAGIFTVASAGSLLSSVHLRGRADGALLGALKGFVPWLLTCLLVGVIVTLASFALLVPGIVIGLRLFWADELALTERLGPVSAVTRSWELTRGVGGRIFFLQLRMGLLYLAIWAVLTLIVVGAILALDLDPTRVESAAAAPLQVALTSFCYALVYALFHAIEIVFFYGLREAQEQRLPDGRLRRDGIARALRAVHAAAAESANDETGAPALPIAALIALPLTLALHLALTRWAFGHADAPLAAAVVHLALWVAMPLFFALAAVSLRTRLLDAWSSAVRVVVAVLVLLLPVSAFALRSDLSRAVEQSESVSQTRALAAIGESCVSECEATSGDATRCGWTCDCVVRRSRKLPPDQLADLVSNFESERAVAYFQRTFSQCR